MSDDVPHPDAGPADETTGLPGLRTWSAVYGLVVAVFVAYVVLLVLLSRAFA
ncbi:MAG TPA: hypothetical protein VF595_06265 [Tepidisphaeraceae bacterium]|jgi:hypothetical protein